MNCQSLLDRILEISEGRRPSLSDRAGIALHLLICPRCIEKVARFDLAGDIIRNDFFSPAPGLTGAIMARIAEEEPDFDLQEENLWTDRFGEFASWKYLREVTLRSWVVIGFLILISLGSAFLGLDFVHIAASQGSAYLVPLGLTIGVFVTGYGALFIGSHLKELSERFGLH